MSAPEPTATLIYFLESYFTISVNWADLPALGQTFRQNERATLVAQLIAELHQIDQHNDWALVEQLALTHSFRRVSIDKARQLVSTLLSALGAPSEIT